MTTTARRGSSGEAMMTATTAKRPRCSDEDDPRFGQLEDTPDGIRFQ